MAGVLLRRAAAVSAGAVLSGMLHDATARCEPADSHSRSVETSSIVVPRAAMAVAIASHPAPQSVVPIEDDYADLDLSHYSMTHHMLHSALKGDDLLEEYRLALSADRKRLRANARLGHKVCGHPKIVHGGAIAALLDDTLGTLFIASGCVRVWMHYTLQRHACFVYRYNGFTANLNVDYKKPLPAGADVVIRARVVSEDVGKSGRSKVTLEGVIADAADASVVYSMATALFIAKSIPTSDHLATSFKAAAAEAAASSAGSLRA